MAKNWRKEYKDLDEKYDKLRDKHRNYWNSGEKWAYSIWWMFVAVVLTLIVLSLIGAFDSPIKELGLDKGELVKEYTLKYYPEFENCSIEYDTCYKLSTNIFGSCIEGIKIYCQELDNRDDLKVLRGIEPTEVLLFDGIDLEDILLDKIKG